MNIMVFRAAWSWKSDIVIYFFLQYTAIWYKNTKLKIQENIHKFSPDDLDSSILKELIILEWFGWICREVKRIHNLNKIIEDEKAENDFLA